MSRLAWTAAAVFRRIGPPGWAAAALLLACAGWWFTVHEPALHDAAQLQAEIGSLEQRLAMLGKGRVAAPPTPHEQLAQFRRRLASERDFASSLALILAAGRRHSLVLDRAAFKLTGDAGDSVWRYSIELPVRTDYRALRRFVLDVRQTLPALALVDLSLRRADAKSAQLDARLRWVLFVAASS
jgi:hypothetical protein